MDRTSGTGTNKFHVKVIRNLDRFVLCDEVIFLTWEYINLVHSQIYVAFKGIRNIADIMFFKNRLDIIINMRKGELNDPLKLTSDVSNIGHNGNGDYRLSLDSVDLIEEVMFLIRQSWKKNK
jgi:predicted transport protein